MMKIVCPVVLNFENSHGSKKIEEIEVTKCDGEVAFEVVLVGVGVGFFLPKKCCEKIYSYKYGNVSDSTISIAEN